jgi:hypothetical protein
MNAETLINIIAHCTTAFSALGLLIHIFGDPENRVWDNKIKAWLAKGGLSVTTCGSILNVLSPTIPETHEVVLNIGISITFFWLNWWQWEMFKAMQLRNKKTTLKKTARKITKPKTKRSV